MKPRSLEPSGSPFSAASIYDLLRSDVFDASKLPAQDHRGLQGLAQKCNSFREDILAWQGVLRREKEKRDEICKMIDHLLSALADYDAEFTATRDWADDWIPLPEEVNLFNSWIADVHADHDAFEYLISALEAARLREIPKPSDDRIFESGGKRSDWDVGLFSDFKRTFPNASDRDGYRFVAAVSRRVIGTKRKEGEAEVDMIEREIVAIRKNLSNKGVATIMKRMERLFPGNHNSDGQDPGMEK